MKAMQIKQFGSCDEFYKASLDKPELEAGEVLVKVAATSVNPLDCKLRDGTYSDLIPTLPWILQGDVAGIIQAVHPSVKSFKPGDEVYGCVGGFLGMPGGLAEYVACDWQLLARKPKTLTLIESAALPLVVETAWEGLFNKARLEKGQRVLVYGGTGGVGHIAALLAKVRGADVTVTVSSNEKAAIVRERLGIENIIDYKNESVSSYVERLTDGRGFDVVFDTVGGENLTVAMESVANNGHVITILPVGAYELGGAFKIKNASLHCIFQPLPLITGQDRLKYHELLTEAAGFIDQHHIKPLIDPNQYSLEEVAEAHRQLESGDAIGKVVITI